MSNINVMRKNLGPVTAYKYAVSKGFTGTEEEFAELMASYASIAQDVSAESRVAEGYALGKQNGVDVGDQSPYYHANAKYHAEQAAAQAAVAEAAAEQAEGAVEVDDTLSVKGRAADAKVTGNAFNSIVSAYPDYTQLMFRSGGINSNGSANPDLTNRICSEYVYSIPQIQSGDAYSCDDLYEMRVAIYETQTMNIPNFITFVNDYLSGTVIIPSEYSGKYAAVLIRKVGYFDDDISEDVATINEHVKYKSNARSFKEISTKDDSLFQKGNNLLALVDRETQYKGVTITIKNGVITLSGTATNDIRVNVSTTSANYIVSSASNVPTEWYEDAVLSQFEVGETYSLHNLILSGNLPNSGVGVNLRDSTNTVRVSRTIPEATLSGEIAYAMLIIEKNAVVDVSFVPAFIKGTANDSACYKKLSEHVAVPGIKHYATPDLSKSYIYDSTFEYAIIFPQTYSPKGYHVPLVIICHGLSSTLNGSSWGQKSVADKFVNAGYAVMDVNQVTSQDWCNPSLITKYIRALKDITSKYNVVPEFVYGLSMGSLIGLCLSTIITGIKACAISGIRLDFEARYDLLSDMDKAIVNNNLSFTNGFDAYMAAGWCKTAFSCIDADNNNINPIQFPPTIFIVGSTDTLTKTESLAKIDEIRRGGTICSVNEYEGDHGDVCALNAGTSLADTLEWFDIWKY